MFFGVADLDDGERKEFLDEWLTRAAKVHDDDFTLNPRRMLRSSDEPRSTGPMTAVQYELSQQQASTPDAPQDTQP